MENVKTDIMSLYDMEYTNNLKNEMEEVKYHRDINKVSIEILNMIELKLLSITKNDLKEEKKTVENMQKFKYDKLSAIEDSLNVLGSKLSNKNKFENILDNKLKNLKKYDDIDKTNLFMECIAEI